jgi:ribosomal protein L29
MKKKDLTALRSKSIKDLLKMVSEKSMDLKKKSVEIMAGKEKNLKAAGALKNDIAQIKTVIKENQLIEMMKSVNEKKEENK